MYPILFQAHSGFRYLVLFALVIAFLVALYSWLTKQKFGKAHKVLNLVTLITTHLQVVIGLVLYFFSPLVQYNAMGQAMKDPTIRYWTVEHLVLMLVAAVLITVGNSKSKKVPQFISKHRPIAIYFGLALLLIVVAILQSGRPLLGSTIN